MALNLESKLSNFSGLTQSKQTSWYLGIFYGKVKVDRASERKLYCNSVHRSMTQSPNLRPDGETAAVTGGTSGIGLAIAKVFAGADALVKSLDFNGECAEAAASVSGGKAPADVCDLADNANSASVLAGIVVNGPMGIVVNSVGMANIGTVATPSAANFERMMRVNVSGYFYAMKAVGHLRDAGGGVVLNMSLIARSSTLADRFAFHQKGPVMTYFVACVHTPLVDGYPNNTYPGCEDEMYKVLSAAQPIGRMVQHGLTT
jgi:2-keto-3-deoxy-L-fuconate dehydrogenase